MADYSTSITIRFKSLDDLNLVKEMAKKLNTSPNRFITTIVVNHSKKMLPEADKALSPLEIFFGPNSSHINKNY